MSALLSASCASRHAAEQSGTREAGPEQIDFATPFLSEVCSKTDPTEFAAAWLKFEESRWDVYGAFLYQQQSDRDERPKLAKELAEEQRERTCELTRRFVSRGDAAAREMRACVERITGTAPTAPLYFAPALQWTDGRADTVKGRDSIFFNARHDSFETAAGMSNAFAHELAHNALEIRFHDAALSPMLKALYREGSATYVAELCTPSEKRYVNHDPLHPDRQKVMAVAAKDLLDGLSSKEWAPIGPRFFRGGMKDPVLPPRMGYTLGYEIFKRNQGVCAPEQFEEVARKQLAEIAAGK
ncbi:MAG: hypothetical protein ACJ790_07510 [Myxococcaceae bacterium]